MKRQIMTFAAVFAAASAAFAAETTADMAETAARNWAAANADTFAPVGDALAASAEYDSDGSILWWVVPFSNGGAVIASPDTRIEPIISVLPSYSGAIPADHPLRVMLTLDIRKRLKLVGCEEDATSSASGLRLRKSGGKMAEDRPAMSPVVEAAVKAATAKWADLVPTGPRLKAAPIFDDEPPYSPACILGICSGFEYGGVYTHWNQSKSPYSFEPDQRCYNYHTPYNAVCGCVATAGAAMMQYFGSDGPKNIATNICSWGLYLIDCKETYKDEFTMIGGTYDWSILPSFMGGSGGLDGYKNEYLSKEQIDLLGRATYDMGVGVGMMWALDGESSGSMVVYLADAYRNYYGFSDARAVELETKEQVHAVFDKLIYSQIRNKIPVALGIRSPSLGGHAVLAVGYGKDKAGSSYTRIFMGWAGKDDAWYCLPVIDEDFELVDEIVTMVGKDDTKTVPVVGRVVTTNKVGATVGAAFVTVNVGGVTNVVTDASGYWAARINEEGLALESGVAEFITSTTNKCQISDKKGVAAINAAMAAYESDPPPAVSESANVGSDTFPNAFEHEIIVSTNTVDDMLCLVTNDVVRLKRYLVNVDCANAIAPTNAFVGAYAFDAGNVTSRVEALVYSIPDDVTLEIPYGKALTPIPGTEDPYLVATNAMNEGKMIFMLVGHSDTEAYANVISSLSGDVEAFNDKYVLYLIDPEKDAYRLKDGDPSFGVFDPSLFNSDSPDRWAFYNGRLSYFNVTNGVVTSEDVQKVLDDASLAYSKHKSNITIIVSPGIDGVATNGFDVTPEAYDWMGRHLSGYGVYTDCFTDGQPVAFYAPSIVVPTNGNSYAYAINGYVVYNNEDVDRLNELYEEWIEVGEYFGDKIFEDEEKDFRWSWMYAYEPADMIGKRIKDLYWNLRHHEDYPSPFAPPAEENLMWVTNSPSSVCCFETNCVADVNWTLQWRYAVTSVWISVSAENGSVSTNGNQVLDGGVWASLSTNDSDKITFTASSDVPGVTFRGWSINPYCDVDVTSETIELPTDQSYSIKAVYMTDNSCHLLNYSWSPSSIPVTMKAIIPETDDEGKKTQETNYWSTADSWSSPPCSVTLEMPSAVAVTNFTELGNMVVSNYYCVGWKGSGSVPSLGRANACTFVLTNNSSICWLWSTNSSPRVGNPYYADDIKFTVLAGDGAPEGGVFEPAVGLYDKAYTNGQTIVCIAPNGVTNEVDCTATVCAGWELTKVGGTSVSGDGNIAEITFEKKANWTLTWKWRTEELVCIDVSVEADEEALVRVQEIKNAKDESGYMSQIVAFYLKGSYVDFVVNADYDHVFDHLEGDVDGCSIVGCDATVGYTITVPADANRSLKAVFTKSIGYASLKVASVCTNDAEGVSVNWGTVSPEVDENSVMNTGGQMVFKMSGSPYTNVVDDVTNVWVCAGWRLYPGTTDLLADVDGSTALASGTGTTASFEFMQDSSLVWIWKEELARSPLPPTLEGPTLGETTPLLVNSADGKTVVTIANTAKGWWYGLYSSTSLMSPIHWSLVPGKKQLATSDGEIITFEYDWDPTSAMMFFKIMVTEDEP